ncbi:MAG: hypothetical protein HYV63_30710 [Candidatus Schekmanbacteria bacterium]|nr:hypothetical protein [Candidatus Schekmanbacteria bacterium]
MLGIRITSRALVAWARALLLAAVLAACGGAPAPLSPAPDATPAKRDPVEVEAQVDSAQATTGDQILFSVRVDTQTGAEISIPEVGADIGGFRVIDMGRDEPVESLGRTVMRRWYKLRADIVGSYVLPAVEVSFKLPDGTEGKRKAPEIFVEVKTVLAAEGAEQDIRGLKRLRAVKRPFPVWAVYAGGGLLLVAGSTTALWIHHRRRRGLAGAPLVPAHVAAYAELDRLRQLDLSTSEGIRAFFFGISAALRLYLERRFGLAATDMTSEQLLVAARGLPDLDRENRTRLESFLRGTDQVKFADHAPADTEVEAVYEAALKVVETTEPVESVAAAAGLTPPAGAGGLPAAGAGEIP